MANMRVVVGVEVTDAAGNRFTHQLLTANASTGDNPLYFAKDFTTAAAKLTEDVQNAIVARCGDVGSLTR